LRAKNLSKTYSGDVKAVQSIDLDIGSNREILGLLGANGAGKSSTFNMATMQLKRTSGDISIFGKDISSIERLREVNITAQQDILWPYLSIKEHFRVISLLTGMPNFEKRYNYLSKQLELDKSYKTANILSGGNKRKLCTALTILSAPKLAFFDEPTTGLDPVCRRNLLRLIKKGDSSVLFTTHRLDEAEYLCSRVAIMQHGKILFDGPIDEIKYKFTQHLEGADGNNFKQQGLVIVEKPKEDLGATYPFLLLQESDSSQALYKIIFKADKDPQPLSQIFKLFSDLKAEGKIKDFTYFEPSLHNAFVALNKDNSTQ
jgi:ABC-2 type transport system ATP-binding protein